MCGLQFNCSRKKHASPAIFLRLVNFQESLNLSSKEVSKGKVWLINLNFSSFLKPGMEAVTTEFSDPTNSNLI